jgi:hypothetical protein
MRLDASLPSSLNFEATKGLVLGDVKIKEKENIIIHIDFLHKND